MNDSLSARKCRKVDGSRARIPLRLIRRRGCASYEPKHVMSVAAQGVDDSRTEEPTRSCDGDAGHSETKVGLERALFEAFFHCDEETCGIGTVDESVVVGE